MSLHVSHFTQLRRMKVGERHNLDGVWVEKPTSSTWNVGHHAGLRMLTAANELARLSSQPKWHRTAFGSTKTIASTLELIVIKTKGESPTWQWTSRGRTAPGATENADARGWVECESRDAAEHQAGMPTPNGVTHVSSKCRTRGTTSHPLPPNEPCPNRASRIDT